MTGFECLKLAGSLNVCGLNGNCINETFCACNPGWSKSTEVAFYLSEEQYFADIDDPILGNQICDTNNTLLQTAYGFTLAVTTCVFLYQGVLIRSVKHLKRLGAFMLCCVSSIAYCLLRLIESSAYFGQDPLATILFAIVHVSGNAAVLVFNYRFISYQLKAARTHGAGLRTITKYNPNKIKYLQIFLQLLDFIVGILFIASTFVNTLKETATLLRVAFGIYAFRIVYQTWASRYLTFYVISDLDKVINEVEPPASELRDSRVDILDNGMSMHDNTLIENFRRSRKGLKIVYYSVTMYTVLMGYFYFMAAVSNIGLSAFKYFMPIQIVSGMLWSIVVLKAWKHNSIRKNASTIASKKTDQSSKHKLVSSQGGPTITSSSSKSRVSLSNQL